jgi:uncharacterized membrane protein YhhN
MEIFWLLIVLLGCILQTVFICFEYRKKFLLALIFKGLASLTFILLGAAGFFATKGAQFGGLVLGGLICGGIGDVLLNLPQLGIKAKDKVFLSGMAAFSAGHFLYVAALLTRGAGALYIAVPLAAALSAILLWYILKRIDVEGKIRVCGIAYIAVVLFMTCCAIGQFILSPGNTGYLLFSIGAVLFTASDVILVFHLYGRNKPRALRAWNLTTYYLGQILIALAVLFI